MHTIFTKGFWLFWIDVASATSFIGLVISGAILTWGLPHGPGLRGAAAREMLGLSRHEWGEVHFWVSLAFVAAIGIHLLLHLGWIKSALCKYLGLSFFRRRSGANLLQ